MYGIRSLVSRSLVEQMTIFIASLLVFIVWIIDYTMIIKESAFYYRMSDSNGNKSRLRDNNEYTIFR